MVMISAFIFVRKGNAEPRQWQCRCSNKSPFSTKQGFQVPLTFLHQLYTKFVSGGWRRLFRGVVQSGIIIYTDGCALGNPGPGGFGAVLMFGQHRKEISEGFTLTTNNRMELLAVISALEKIKEPGHAITIFTDSKYVCNAVTEGWLFNWEKKGWNKVKNPDLWQKFLPLYRKFKPRFKWVKGHAGNVENERCDQLANAAALHKNKKIDRGYIPNDPSGKLL